MTIARTIQTNALSVKPITPGHSKLVLAPQTSKEYLSDFFEDMQEAAELSMLRTTGRFGFRHISADNCW
jgi:hypothetical protein